MKAVKTQICFIRLHAEMTVDGVDDAVRKVDSVPLLFLRTSARESEDPFAAH